LSQTNPFEKGVTKILFKACIKILAQPFPKVVSQRLS